MRSERPITLITLSILRAYDTKKIIAEVKEMVTHILIGALIGVIVGHLIPPGHFFWFIVGGLGGYIGQCYIGWRYKKF